MTSMWSGAAAVDPSTESSEWTPRLETGKRRSTRGASPTSSPLDVSYAARTQRLRADPKCSHQVKTHSQLRNGFGRALFVVKVRHASSSESRFRLLAIGSIVSVTATPSYGH